MQTSCVVLTFFVVCILLYPTSSDSAAIFITMILETESSTSASQQQLDQNRILKRVTYRDVNVTQRAILQKRKEFALKILEEMKVISTDSVIMPPFSAKQCVHNKGRMMNKFERSLAFTHFDIWREFSFFDVDYDKFISHYKEFQTKNKPARRNHWAESMDSFDVINGTRLKNGVVYDANDIMIILEDDAELAVSNYEEILHRELQIISSPQMGFDFMFLGWCDSNSLGAPLCTHAYAINRTGADILSKYFHSCGLQLDIQIAIMCTNKRLRCRKANLGGTVRNDKYKVQRHADKSKGIIHQADIWHTFFAEQDNKLSR